MVDHIILRYRQKNSITQKRLAHEMGVTHGVISRVERNIGNESVRRILVWCIQEGVSPYDIFPPEKSA